MEIGLYEDWMKPQVAKLFCLQYGVNEDNFSKLIDNFYEHPFQKDKCIRIVAKEGKTIIGFQSFIYWPYEYNNKTYNSFQSGNSLVHPNHRGKGIFQKLLNYLDLHCKELEIDFLIGFPIDASIGSLLRNNWQNIFNLQWYVKIWNPFSIFLPLNKKKINTHFPNKNLFPKNKVIEPFIKLSNTKDFSEWRSIHNDEKNYFSFYFQNGENEMILKLKLNIRKKIIKELIIGDFITTNYDTIFIDEAFSAFFNELKKIKCISIVSLAINDNNISNLKSILLNQRFRKIKKQIYFCFKPLLDKELISEKDKWIVLRGDIDTW